MSPWTPAPTTLSGAPWEAHSGFEFTPVALTRPLFGVPQASSAGGLRLRKDTWEGSKQRLAEHFGPPGNLALRFESWAGDVCSQREASAARAAARAAAVRQHKPRLPAKRGLPPPDSKAARAKLGEFLQKRGMPAPL
jgi:hypothetical protein